MHDRATAPPPRARDDDRPDPPAAWTTGDHHGPEQVARAQERPWCADYEDAE